MALEKNSKIYVAGHRGLVGSAIYANLQKRGFHNLIGRTHGELDLMDAVAVKRFFDEERPDAVVLAAAHVSRSVFLSLAVGTPLLSLPATAALLDSEHKS